MLKRFLLFAGATYYPSGGWDDFVDSFDSVEAAKDRLLKPHSWADWSHIVDTTTGSVCWSSNLGG